MSITVQLDLPDPVAAEARAKGLLDPQKLTRLVEREVELDMSPVTSKPASRGRIKTGHSEAGIS
jgi:hypothetical protein